MVAKFLSNLIYIIFLSNKKQQTTNKKKIQIKTSKKNLESRNFSIAILKFKEAAIFKYLLNVTHQSINFPVLVQYFLRLVVMKISV